MAWEKREHKPQRLKAKADRAAVLGNLCAALRARLPTLRPHAELRHFGVQVAEHMCCEYGKYKHERSGNRAKHRFRIFEGHPRQEYHALHAEVAGKLSKLG